MEEKKKITVSGLLHCLEEGMTREDIAKHYGISMKEVRQHFQHPKLKGKKPLKPMESILVDDTAQEEVQGDLFKSGELYEPEFQLEQDKY